MHIGISLNKGYHFGVPIIMIIVFRGLFGAPYFGKLPYTGGISAFRPMQGLIFWLRRDAKMDPNI